MEKIASFTVDHLRLLPGVYVSRKDHVGAEVITTAEIHAVEHLGATFLRNHDTMGEKVVYFGPMGCRTGFYLILAGDYESEDIVTLLTEMFTFIRDYEGTIPGAAAKDCGNYLDLNLPMAKYVAKKYLEEVLEHISDDRLHYPA